MSRLNSVSDPEGRAVLRLRRSPVVEAHGGDIRMAEPLLDLDDVRFVRERVGGGRGAQRIGAMLILAAAMSAGCASLTAPAGDASFMRGVQSATKNHIRVSVA